jgi:hypothetical protein
MPTSTIYVNRIAKPPKFEFMLKDSEFYINTPGVSVTDPDKSYTALSDGLFYVLNTNKSPIIFNSLTIGTLSLRNNSIGSSDYISATLGDTTYDINGYRYDNYVITYKDIKIGALTISTNQKWENGQNVKINPFQSLEFGATYTVINVNNLGVQYYGNMPDKLKGVLDIDFLVKCYRDVSLTDVITQNLTISVNLINTGYIPDILAGTNDTIS